MGVVEEAVAAIRAGKLVVLPTDTVYGLCASPYRYEPAERVYRLKHRPPELPSALMASDLEMLFECVPELRGRAGTIARTLLPGPYTLVLPNPARRYRWLTGSRQDAIGARVPELAGDARKILDGVGAVLATSANLAVCVDGGELPGTPSTVLDFTGSEPVVVREGAVPSAKALARVGAFVS